MLVVYRLSSSWGQVAGRLALGTDLLQLKGSQKSAQAAGLLLVGGSKKRC